MIKRKAFTMIEMGLALTIMTSIMIGLIYATKTSNENLNRANEINFYRVFDNAVKVNFETILNTFEPICSAINSDAQASWGNTLCNNTSPFPVFVNANIIRYNLDLARLPNATARTSLTNNLVASFSPYCSLNQTTATTVEVYCPNVVNLQYNIGGANIATPHALGADIDPTVVPAFTLTYKRVQTNGNVVTNITHTGNFTEVYTKRQNYTLEKWNTIRKLMKQIYETKMSLELNNPPTIGLNSMFDEFVPYFWEVFGNTVDPSTYPLCNMGGGTTCANLNTNNFWQSGVNIAYALVMRRLKQNLLSSDIYNVDGFNNMVRVYPILSDCANNNILTCNISSPPIPQNDYQNLKTPPYMGVIFDNTCRDKSINAPEYCRMLIAY